LESHDSRQPQQVTRDERASSRHGRTLTQVVKQRREREKQELRQAILTAARDIALHDGWQALTIRKVAERIEYSPPTIYEYFQSKDDILAELVHEGFVQMGMTLDAVRGLSDNPETRLFMMVDAYVSFALHNPELYQVMHGMGITCLQKPVIERRPLAIALEVLKEWMQDTGVTIPDLEGALEILRSFLHGMVSVYMDGRLSGDEVRLRQLAHRAMQDLFVAWQHS
jgi:AcrR family transcriptional regulator